MNDLPSELWAGHSGECLDQHPHPPPLMHDVEFLDPLPHRAGQDVVCLNKPAPIGSILLRRSRSIRTPSGEEYDLVLRTSDQLIFSRQSRQHIRQQVVEIHLLGVRERRGVQDVDGMVRLGRERRAVEDARGGTLHSRRVFRRILGGRHGPDESAACAVSKLLPHPLVMFIFCWYRLCNWLFVETSWADVVPSQVSGNEEQLDVEPRSQENFRAVKCCG